MRIIQKILFIILTICTFISLTSIVFAGYVLYNVPKLDMDKLYAENTTQIYDKNNVLIAEIGNKRQESINYEEISSHMIHAIIAIEDVRFFEHEGIDYRRLGGAMISNIKQMRFAEGASTINQQLIKNVFLTPDKTIKRKFQEMYLSVQLEQYLTKEQILEAYLNNVLFGKRIYGIERASNYYFGVKASELSISQAALLAGIVQLPNYYNPFNNETSAEKRRNIVLKMMLENKFISYEEYEDALEDKISKQLVQNISLNEYNISSSYIDYVINECISTYQIDPFSSAAKIYTNIDLSIQTEVFKIMSNSTNIFPDDDLNAGIIVLDNKTGDILAIGGNRNNDALSLNYATDVLLQPGSTIKPILDFAPAIEFLNLSTAQPINDEEYYYQTGQIINNWDHLYKGYITMRQALVESRNVPAVKLFNIVGHEKAFSFASRIGIKNNETIYESNALGSFSKGYSVLDIANAYQSFANMGTYIKASPIDKIEISGNVIYPEIKSELAMKPSTAYMINDMLHGVFKNTTYDIPDMYYCAKTGQTNFDSQTINKYLLPNNAVKDSWVVGYTKDITIACWVGYDKISKSHYLTPAKKDLPKKIVKELMLISAPFDKTPFTMPDNLITLPIEINLDNIYLTSPSTSYSKIKYEYFIIGTEPIKTKENDDYFAS